MLDCWNCCISCCLLVVFAVITVAALDFIALRVVCLCYDCVLIGFTWFTVWVVCG